MTRPLQLRGRRPASPEDRDLQREIRALADELHRDRREAADCRLPTGAIALFPEGASPDGWVRCDGREARRRAYPALYALIRDTFGAGDGSATFLMPDLTASEPAQTEYWIWAR